MAVATFSLIVDDKLQIPSISLSLSRPCSFQMFGALCDRRCGVGSTSDCSRSANGRISVSMVNARGPCFFSGNYHEEIFIDKPFFFFFFIFRYFCKSVSYFSINNIYI